MWNTVECVAIGKSHEINGIPCQDKTKSSFSNGVNVVALADGAGSAKFSHHGAQTVVDLICQVLEERFLRFFESEDGILVKKELLNALIFELELTAELQKCSLNDLASTLLAVAVKDDKFIIIHLGDGVIGYIKDNELNVASIPRNGEFANSTYFVTSDSALGALKVIKGKLNGIRGFVLMSDGPEEAFYDHENKMLLPNLLGGMDLCLNIPIEEARAQLQLALEEDIREITDDDCSMIFLVKAQDTKKEIVQINLTKSEQCLNKAKLLGLNELTKKEKYILFGLNNPKKTSSQYQSYENIIIKLQKPQTAKQLTKKSRFLKLKSIQKKLDYLYSLGLINKKDSYYKSVIMINK